MKGLSSKCIALKVDVLQDQKIIILLAGTSLRLSARKLYRLGAVKRLRNSCKSFLVKRILRTY